MFYKKGDILECANYRGITLLNTAYKIFSAILYSRLRPCAEKVVGRYQTDFRMDKSTVDQISTLRQILEKTQEHNIETHHIFVDFKAAYDTINRKKLFKAREELNIPSHLISLIKLTWKKWNAEFVCRAAYLSRLKPAMDCDRGMRYRIYCSI